MSAHHSSASVLPLQPPCAIPQTVLVLDDQSTGRLILAEVIKGIGRNIQLALFSNPLEAVEYARNLPVDLVLTDYRMPQQDGIETIQQLRSMFTYEQLPIVMTTVVNDREVRHRAFEAGATDFLIRPVDPIECRARCENLLNLRQQYLINSVHARVLEERIAHVTDALRRRENDTLARLVRALEARPARERARLQRVGKFAGMIAHAAGMSQIDADDIALAVALHDIVTPRSSDTLQLVELSHLLQLAATMASHHHERFDGTGRPQGLGGEHIPIAARILTLAVALEVGFSSPQEDAAGASDALREVRLDRQAALARIVEGRGREFDPALVDALLHHRSALTALSRSLYLSH